MRKASVLLLVIIVSMPGALLADYKHAFREGARAYEKQNWDLVIANMRTAIAKKPRSDERINIVGGWSERYVPVHYLAAALAQMNRCADAWKALREGAYEDSVRHRKVVEARCGD
jgi:hypothetical protein